MFPCIDSGGRKGEKERERGCWRMSRGEEKRVSNKINPPLFPICQVTLSDIGKIDGVTRKSLLNPF